MKNAAERAWVLIGAGGHAKVVLSLARALGLRVVGVCDPGLAGAGVEVWRGLPVLGDDTALAAYAPDAIALLNGIGQVPGGTARQRIHEQFTTRGFAFPTLAHPSAVIDTTANLADGVQVMAGAIVQTDCRIGAGTIVNTRASIDHDNHIGAHVHIAPGAVLCGGVRVGDETFVGASATLLPLVSVGRRCIVAAGSTLARTLSDGDAHRPHRTATHAPVASLNSLD